VPEDTFWHKIDWRRCLLAWPDLLRLPLFAGVLHGLSLPPTSMCMLIVCMIDLIGIYSINKAYVGVHTFAST
jgi:hypothetical protein